MRRLLQFADYLITSNLVCRYSFCAQRALASPPRWGSLSRLSGVSTRHKAAGATWQWSNRRAVSPLDWIRMLLPADMQGQQNGCNTFFRGDFGKAVTRLAE
jgi:hypothetical protein